MSPDDRARWQRLAPGVYADDAGGLHLVLPEMLEAAGYADTPENQAMLESAAREIFRTIPIEQDDE